MKTKNRSIYKENLKLVKIGEKICTACKQKKLISEFYNSKIRKSGKCYICKVCSEQQIKKSKLKYSERYREKRIYNRNKTPKGRYTSYKQGAKIRKISWNLTLDEFKLFWQKPCHYCGASIETIGLDRINQSKEIGYCLSNVVPCCKDCNIAKSDKSETDFIYWCIRVIKFQEQKGNIAKTNNALVGC